MCIRDRPKIRGYENEKGSVIYLNSGDWIENLTALEYEGGEWSLYRYEEDAVAKESPKITQLVQSHTSNAKVMIG